MTDPTDESLTQWRASLAGGGLPVPSLFRWQALRAGVVNLWEFEAVEYWYADGWAQLMGRNETGKSSLMALTTLIPWLGDTSSDKIDTLGRSGKQFAYYVRPSGDSDRRDAEASLYQGWLWVEYGRIRDGEAHYFTTLLHASARRESATTKLTWCTSHGSRVREALLLTDGRTVRTPSAIEAAGFDVHPTATAYRQRVASDLLGGSIDSLENIGKLLKVTRQPKLGAQLNVDFVKQHLRDSLPELSRDEVDQLAQGWDQLDQLRADLERSRDAVGTVVGLRREAWNPWAGAQLRLRADDAASARTALDKVTEDEQSAHAALDASQLDADAALAARDDAQLRAETARAQAAALRDSTAYREANERAANVTAKREEAASARKAADRSSGALASAHDEAKRAEDFAAQQTADRDSRAKRLLVHEDSIRATARGAGVEAAVALDTDRLRQAGEERMQAVRLVEGLRRDVVKADHAAALADQRAAARQDTADELAAVAQRAWEAAEQELADVRSALDRWTPPEARPLLDGWLSLLPMSADDLAGSPRLSDTIRRDFHDPRNAALVAERARLTAEIDGVAAGLADLHRQIEEVEQQQVSAPPPPALWRRRDRNEANGSPFWRLVNPREGVGAVDLAAVEAALAASGLLDAWVSSDDHSGLDTFLDASARPDGAGAGRTLADVLEVAADSGEQTELVRSILDGVSVHANGTYLPASGMAIALDGSWRVAGLTGRAAPRHSQAEWIGEAARESRRRRRLAELRAEVAVLSGRAQELDIKRQRTDDALVALAELLAQAPSDDLLRHALSGCQLADEAAQCAQLAAASAVEEARRTRTAADNQRASLRTEAQTHRLPDDEDGLRSVQQALNDLRGHLQVWRSYRAELDLAESRVLAAGHDVERKSRRVQEQQAVHSEDQRRAHTTEASLAALEAAINADDTEILGRLTRLEVEADSAETERDALNERRTELASQVARAQSLLDEVARRREDATAVRDTAHRQLRVVLDRGLAIGLPVELPSPDSSTVEAVRAQAAELRRSIHPRGWSESDREANERTLERLRLALNSKVTDARAPLERSGRSVSVVEDGPTPRVEVMVNSNGTTLALDDAVAHLIEVSQALERSYDESVQETLDRLLGSAFLEHLRTRIGQAESLIRDINTVLLAHPTGTDRTTLRIRLEAGSNEGVLAALSGSSWVDPAVAETVRAFLRSKVDEAKRRAADEGRADWRDTLANQLDYRFWYHISLEHRVGDGRWGPLTTRRYAELSGGARAVMLMLPLVAALAAQYQHLPDAPRPLWLDEAFDGLDATNRSMVMSLLQRFDLDVLLAGPGRLVNVEAVPAAAIYQVVRAPAPEPGADLVAELWAGRTLTPIDLPLSWLDAPAEAPPDQDALL